MKKILTLLLILLMVMSCKEREDSIDENDLGHKIIDALNASDDQTVFELSNEGLKKYPNDLQMKYWKAQAYSLRANLDVYSLFPIMKMKLFDVAMSEWSAMNEYSKRSRSEINDLVIGDSEVNSESRLQKKKKEIDETEIEDVEFTFKIKNDQSQIFEGTSYLYCSFEYQIKSKLFLKESWTGYIYESIEVTNDDERNLDYCKKLYPNQDEYKWKHLVHNIAYVMINNKLIGLKDRKQSERLLKASFALYDSVPVLQNVPELSPERGDDIFKALELLQEIKVTAEKNSRIHKNAIQQMGLMAGFLITGSLNDSIRFDQVNEPFDIVCQTNPNMLVGHYPHFRTGMKYLLEVIQDTEMQDKNKENIDKMKKRLENSPEELTPEEKQEIIDQINEYIYDNCD